MAVTAKFQADFSSFYDAVNKAETELKGLETGASKVQSSLNRMVDSFSGRKILQEANIAADAVQRIGGVTKLTEAEQQKLNRTLNEALAKYKALGIEAPSHLRVLESITQKTAAETGKLGTEAAKIPGVFDQLGIKSIALGSAIGGALGGIALSAVSKLGSEMSEFVGKGDRLPALEASFKRLSVGAKQSSEEMLASMQKGTDGMVSNFDLMQTANKALLLGLPVTAQSMGELSETARKLGKAMGQDATKSFDDLITALGRSSPMILDNLGLTVKVGEANDAYAAKLGKTAEQLTEAEKKMAFYEAAMEAARKKTGELGDQTRTLTDIIGIAWTAVENAVTKSASGMNVAIGRVLSRKDEFLQFVQDVGRLGVGIALAKAAARDEMERNQPTSDPSATRKGRRDLTNSDAFQFEELQRKAQDLASKAIIPLTAAQRELVTQLDKGGMSAGKIAEEFKKVKTLAGVTEEQIKKFLDTQKKSGKAGDDYAATLKRIADAQVPLTKGQTEQIDKLAKLGISHGDIAKALRVSEVAVGQYINANNKLNDLIGKQIPLIQRTKDEWLKMANVNIFNGQTLIDQVRKSVLDADQLPEWAKGTIILTDEQAAKLAIQNNKRIGDHIVATMGTKLADLKNELKDIGFGAAQDIASVLGEGIRTGDWSHFNESLKAVLSHAIGSAAAAAVNAVVPGLGSILQPIFSALSDKLLGALGLGTKGRDLVKKFAEQFGGFDGLRKTLSALGEEGERLWRRLTQGVGRDNPKEAQAAIDAVTAALDRHRAAVQKLADSVGTLADRASGSGQLLSESMRPYIEAARNAGFLTDELSAKLLGMTSSNAAGWREMQALAEKFGIDIGALGQTFQQQKLTETASEIVSAFERLVGNGADFNAVLEGMSDEINAVVIESLKFGTQIPENMRPWIAKLIEAGKLVDAAGHKITDIDRLQFGPEVKSDIEKLEDAIRDLIQAIGGDLPAAIAKLDGKQINIGVNYQVNGPKGFPSGMTQEEYEAWLENRPKPELSGYASGTPGLSFMNFGKAKKVILHGNEAVIPEGRVGELAAQIASALGGVGGGTAIFELEGRELARGIVPHLGGEVRRYGRGMA